MKLDLDFVKTLLNTINDCENDRVSLGYLFDNIKQENIDNDLFEQKMRHHITLLCAAGFLMSSSSELGFKTCASGELLCSTHTTYWPTLPGYQLLESLNNDTLFNKITKGLQNIGIDTLRQIPALALDYIAKNCLGL